jgi:hypothetical protein
VSEIETEPRTKQPWEYQVGWARQNLDPNELGYFIKGLVGGLYVPSTSVTRPDRVDRDAKELNRRVRKTQEAQNKFRFRTRASADTKNNIDSNFINMIRQKEQESLKSMQTENNKTFNTLYNKFILLEKNKFKLKANIIKHLSTGNQYLKEQNEIQDESPGVLGTPFGENTLAGLIAAGAAIAGAVLKSKGISTAFNRKHAQLTGKIRNIKNTPGLTPTAKINRIKAQAEAISRQPDDYGYGKLGKHIFDNSNLYKHIGLGVLSAGNVISGSIRDINDYNEGHGNLKIGEIVAKAVSRAMTPYLAYGTVRGAASLSKLGARHAARRWSQKHKKLDYASRALTRPIQSTTAPHPKYKGQQFGRIYDRNPSFGNDAFTNQPTIRQIWAQSAPKTGQGRVSRFSTHIGRPFVTTYKVSNPFKTGQVLPKAVNTGRGLLPATVIAGGALALKDEVLSGLNTGKNIIGQSEIPVIGDIAKIVPDFGVPGSAVNALTNTNSLRDDPYNPEGTRKGYRPVSTLSTQSPLPLPGLAREKIARQQQIRTSTKDDGTPSHLPNTPNTNSRYLVTKRDASLANRILRLFGGTEPEYAITIDTANNPTSKISTRSRQITPEEEKKLKDLLRSQR